MMTQTKTLRRIFLGLLACLVYTDCGSGMASFVKRPLSLLQMQSISSVPKVQAQPSTRPVVPVRNPEWTPRTLVLHGRTLYYSFGTGNPPEVSLAEQERMQARNKCPSPWVAAEQKNACYPETGYITPEIERLLRDMLLYADWDKFLAECSVVLDPLKNEELRYYADTYPSFKEFSDPQFRDINRWLSVDERTGRKILTPRFSLSLEWIDRAVQLIKERNSVYVPGNQTCSDTYGVILQAQIIQLHNEYYGVK